MNGVAALLLYCGCYCLYLTKHLMLMMLMISTRVFNVNNDKDGYRHKKLWN